MYSYRIGVFMYWIKLCRKGIGNLPVWLIKPELIFTVNEVEILELS